MDERNGKAFDHDVMLPDTTLIFFLAFLRLACALELQVEVLEPPSKESWLMLESVEELSASLPDM